MQRRTRIVATLGPSTDPPEILDQLLAAGMNVARINFSHGAGLDQCERIALVRSAAQRQGRSVAVLADLPGPKLRALMGVPLLLEKGQEVRIGFHANAKADLQVTDPDLIRQVHAGQRLLLDDGRLQLQALRADKEALLTRVVTPGSLVPNKGINLPDTELHAPALTARDRQALEMVARVGADWLALSFVRSANAAHELRQAARELGLLLPIMAKIERPEAVQHALEIIDSFDGIMIARGDLGVEMALERVPHLQKRLINMARAAGKPVVTATDMLDSMRANPQPTRAEASDVANAIYDGTDGVMLSGETAIGKYPLEAMAYMDKIVREAECHLGNDGFREVFVPRGAVDDHLTHVTCTLARDLHANAIVAPTNSGRTPRLVARHRPQSAIVAPAPNEAIARQLNVLWGVEPVVIPPLRAGQDRLEAAVHAAFSNRILKKGDLAVLLAGHPIEGGERWPTIRVIRVAEAGRSLSP